MNRLTFKEKDCPLMGKGYAVLNSDNLEICAIHKVRCGQWMHWSLVFTQIHSENLKGDAIYITPGCQDEIREKCRQLGSLDRKVKKKCK